MVVGVDAGAVAVGPEDPDGVAADGGDAVGPDRGRDGGGVEEGVAVPFVHAARARAAQPQLAEGMDGPRAVGPVEDQRVARAEDPGRDGRGGLPGGGGRLSAGGFGAISASAREETEFGEERTAGRPASPARPSEGSSGTRPRKGTPCACATRFPPPSMTYCSAG